MRPNGIRVFDGLRIATEHVEHLQDSLHSSVEELREAAGLGRVIRGFPVRADGDAAIVVGPGLAFDRGRHRLAIDEPQRVAASIPAGRETQYVCLQHEGVEDGEVEGRATLVWDSVTILFRDAPPEPTEEPIAIAKLIRTSAGFAVAALDPAPIPSTPEPTTAPAPAAATAPTGPAPTAATTPATPEGPDVAAPAVPPTDTAQVPAAPARPPIVQGVARLPALDAAAVDPIGALRAAFTANAGEGAAAIVVPLATVEAAGPIAVEAVSCIVHVAVTVLRGDGTAARLEAAGQGEATFAGSGSSRFGVATVRAVPAPGATGGTWIATEWTDTAVTALPLAPALDGAPLEGLRLLVDVAPAAPAGFGIACALGYDGPVDALRTTALQERLSGLTWSVTVGWKALPA